MNTKTENTTEGGPVSNSSSTDLFSHFMKIEDRIFKRIPIDWADLFKQAEISPCKARLCFTNLGGFTLDIGDPTLMLCVSPPEVEGSTKTIIRDGEWCFCK